MLFQLHLRRVRRLLGRDVTANLVAALVFSRLHYGNALLALLAELPHCPSRPISVSSMLLSGSSTVCGCMITLLRQLPAEARI